MIDKGEGKSRNIAKSFYARQRRRVTKSIKLEKMLNLFRKNRKLRKKR